MTPLSGFTLKENDSLTGADFIESIYRFMQSSKTKGNRGMLCCPRNVCEDEALLFQLDCKSLRIVRVVCV